MVKYDYTAYGTITSITGTLASTIGQYNPFRYKGYYYDTETKMYYCKSRYYVPEWCRWLNGDSVAYLNPQDFNGMNLFSYCNNNPVMLRDSSGRNWWNDFWKSVADVAVTIVFVAAGMVVRTYVTSIAGSFLGNIAGVVAAGAVNNGVNAIYYNNITADGKKFQNHQNDMVSIKKYGNRWDRLQNIKDRYYQYDGSTSYGFNQWRSYSEYSLHMYGWALTGWAYGKENSSISQVAGHFEAAEITLNEWDYRWYVDIATILLGILGL